MRLALIDGVRVVTCKAGITGDAHDQTKEWRNRACCASLLLMREPHALCPACARYLQVIYREAVS